MLLKNKDASSVTLRNQNRMLYANYRIQQNRVEGGCQLRIKLETGGTGDFSIFPKLLQGERETTVLELITDLSANACPVLSVDPLSADQIYQSLTTSRAAYLAADTGSWIAITSTEYTALQTNVVGTALAGINSTDLVGAAAAGYTFNDFPVANNSTPSLTPPISANTYIYAFAIKIRNSITATLDNIRVYANASTSVYSGFTMVGSSPIPIPVAGVNYYVYKGQTTVNAATDGLLAVTAPGNATASLAQSMHLAYKQGMDTSVRWRWLNTATLPLTSGTTLSSLGSQGWGMAIQALTTPTKQWV